MQSNRPALQGPPPTVSSPLFGLCTRPEALKSSVVCGLPTSCQPGLRVINLLGGGGVSSPAGADWSVQSTPRRRWRAPAAAMAALSGAAFAAMPAVLPTAAAAAAADPLPAASNRHRRPPFPLRPRCGPAADCSSGGSAATPGGIRRCRLRLPARRICWTASRLMPPDSASLWRNRPGTAAGTSRGLMPRSS